MTETEALDTAKRIADALGWTWIEPARAVKVRGWMRGDRWQIVTNRGQRGCNVRITLSDNGYMISGSFCPR